MNVRVSKIDLKTVDYFCRIHDHFLSLIEVSHYLSSEGKTGCSVEDVLIFFTGTDKIPPLGFEKVPTITFLHCSTAKFATASTCDPELQLPTCHGDDMDTFIEDMIMS